MLVVHLVTVNDPVFLNAAMTADIQNRRDLAFLFRGAIQVAGDIQARSGLKGDVFDDEAITFDRTCDFSSLQDL